MGLDVARAEQRQQVRSLDEFHWLWLGTANYERSAAGF
jgi:hypothetical protein